MKTCKIKIVLFMLMLICSVVSLEIRNINPNIAEMYNLKKESNQDQSKIHQEIVKDDKTNDENISAGQIGGIVVGSVAAFSCICLVGFCIKKKCFDNADGQNMNQSQLIGGGNQYVPIIIDVQKTEIQRIIVEYEKNQIQAGKQLGMEAMNKLFANIFLLYLKFLKFKRLRRFPSLKSTKILVGQSGVGKSSLINTLFGTNESVALSDCTQSIKKVYSTNLVEIFDSPGELSSFDLSQVKVEKEFLDKESCPFETLAQYDEVYVLYDTSLKKIEQFVKALNALRTKGIYFVRNKCDTFDARQKRTVNQQLQVDRQLLQRWGVPAHKIVIFTASSENKQRQFGNTELKSKLLRQVSDTNRQK